MMKASGETLHRLFIFSTFNLYFCDSKLHSA